MSVRTKWQLIWQCICFFMDYFWISAFSQFQLTNPPYHHPLMFSFNIKEKYWTKKIRDHSSTHLTLFTHSMEILIQIKMCYQQKLVFRGNNCVIVPVLASQVIVREQKLICILFSRLCMDGLKKLNLKLEIKGICYIWYIHFSWIGGEKNKQLFFTIDSCLNGWLTSKETRHAI